MKERLSREFFFKIILAGLFVFAVMSNIQLISRNHQLNVILSDKKKITREQDLKNKKLKSLIAYYQTPSFQEVEARRRLGLKKPEETVYTIKGLTDATNQDSPLSDTIYQDVAPTAPAPQTNFQHWWSYFFGR